MATAGDLDAFEALVRQYQDVAYRAAVALGAGSDAEDVVQEAFVKVYRHLARFRQGHPFRPWLLQIVNNETKNLHRSRDRHHGLTRRVIQLFPSDAQTGDDDPHLHVLRSERERMVWNALRTLPQKDRSVLACRYFLELSENETAQILGWARGSVKSRTSRALRRLHTAISADTGEEVSIDLRA